MASSTAALSVASSIAKVTATIVGNAGAAFQTTLPHAPTATKAASASILDPSHPDPTKFDASDPLALFIIQASLIIFLSRFLHLFLSRLRQPRVISEVIAGLIIGPTAFGRIPHFTAHIFPPASISYLNLVSTIGLVLFLFLVGLEVDFSVFRRNFRASATISVVGIVVPFALGAAVSVGLYKTFIDDSKVKFGTFLLFIGTANGITAFPVLARILTELNLLQDHVGVTVLAAGVGNDVIGWILLALAIALVNASSGIIILYIILCAVGWILILWFLVRPLLVWACRKTGSFGNRGPTEGIVCGIVFLVLASAWVTDRIGIHAIFGGFVVGLIVPTPIRGAITEKIEDLVSVLFLPLYFALSGLKTDLGLLSDGSIWGWAICVIVVAFFGKFLSCGIVAKANGMNWRESGAVGSLMACKGLVELIVLNIGLSSGILNSQVFAIFVLMALVTTFLTTPLTILFYPSSVRKQQPRAFVGSNEPASDAPPGIGTFRPTSRYAVVLQHYEQLPALFTFFKLVKAPIQFTESSSTSSVNEKESATPPPPQQQQVTVDALRLVELTERTSTIIKASDSTATLVAADPLSQVWRTFLHVQGVVSTASLSIVSQDQFPALVASHAVEHASDLVVVPWALQARGTQPDAGVVAGFLPNPFEGMFRRNGVTEGSPQYATFVRRVFAESATDVGLFLFLDRGVDSTPSVSSGRAHLFFAFHGGTDDRACLDFIVQLASRNPGITASIFRIVPSAEPTAEDLGTASTKQSTRLSADEDEPLPQLTVHGGTCATDTIYPTQPNLASETADAISLAVWFEESQVPRRPEIAAGLARISFATIATVRPLHTSIARAEATARDHAVPLVVVAGRGRRDAKAHGRELGEFFKSRIEDVQGSIANSSEVRRSLGDLASAYLVAGVGTSLLVIQSALPGLPKSKAV